MRQECFHQGRILFDNALQMMGLSEGLDGAPLVQGVNTYKGSFGKLLAGVAQGSLQELAGGPLFLLRSITSNMAPYTS